MHTARDSRWFALFVAAFALGGCGETLLTALLPTAPVFTLPLAIDGTPVDPAIVDTGGAYELMLRQRFGLEAIETVEVLVFGGRETVELVQGFTYEVAGLAETADVALVGVPACDCNGVGFLFFRKTGRILHLDFGRRRATLGTKPPAGGVEFSFEPPPPHMQRFDSAFVTVEVCSDDDCEEILGLLDTGTNGTVMRRDLLEPGTPASRQRRSVTIHHPHLGTVAASVRLFDTPGLPDLILGTDVMGAWGNDWYFHFAPEGGTVVVVPVAAPAAENDPSAAAKARPSPDGSHPERARMCNRRG